jgi:hypothetical protein
MIISNQGYKYLSVITRREVGEDSSLLFKGGVDLFIFTVHKLEIINNGINAVL